MVASNHSLWWVALPAIWFIGMVFSHIIFGRCVLNELVMRFKRLAKSDKKHEHNKSNFYERTHLAPQKAAMDVISDKMPTPDLTLKL